MSAGMNVATACPRCRGPAAYGHATQTRIFIPVGPRWGPDLKDSRACRLRRAGGKLGLDYQTTPVSTNMYWAKSAMRRRPHGARFDDGSATVARERYAPRRRQDHEVARRPAAHPLLEMPRTHLVPAGPVRALWLRLRGSHGA